MGNATRSILLPDMWEETMPRIVKCICDNCDCSGECEYYNETMKPILDAARMPFVEDAFIVKLQEAIEEFECEFFE